MHLKTYTQYKQITTQVTLQVTGNRSATSPKLKSINYNDIIICTERLLSINCFTSLGRTEAQNNNTPSPPPVISMSTGLCLLLVSFYRTIIHNNTIGLRCLYRQMVEFLNVTYTTTLRNIFLLPVKQCHIF